MRASQRTRFCDLFARSVKPGERQLMKLITALLIVGDCRERGQRALDSLYGQTIRDAMEIIVIDLAARPTPRLVTRSEFSTNYVVPESNCSWAQARALAFRLARTPVIAYIEDHCIADPGWAEALVRAHQGPWTCVGYSFTNPNPESYLARATIMSEYGMWLVPASSGRARVLPSNNVSYKREQLLQFGDDLENLLTPDFGLFQQLAQRGLEMYFESGARVGHSSHEDLRGQFAASKAFSRLLGARRAQTQKWSWTKRISYGAATPFVAPAIALWRLAASLRHRRSLWREFFISLPVIFLRYPISGLGEAIGYLFGTGSAERELANAELSTARLQAR